MKKGNIYRTYNSSQIGEKNIGENILIGGWIDTIRDHGGISFIDVRDHYGTVQVVVENKEIVDTLKKEQCISAEGIIRLRDISTVNPKINTGTVELLASSVTILGDITSPLPFDISGSKDIREDLR